jgi:ABC-type transporter MlaC component
VDSSFSFLSTAHADLLNEILARRSSTLLKRIRQDRSVSRSDAEEIMTVMSEEFTNNLDDDWEPTEYGRTVGAVMAQFNAARIHEWP